MRWFDDWFAIEALRRVSMADLAAAPKRLKAVGEQPKVWLVNAGMSIFDRTQGICGLAKRFQEHIKNSLY